MKRLFKRRTIGIWILCAIWLTIIFYNGTRPGETSQRSSKEVVKVVSMFINIPPPSIEKASIKLSDVNFYVRKNAHFFQYLIFSVLLCAAVRQLKLYKSSEILLVLFILLLIPVLDEFIQKYTSGRTSNVLDIVIDFSGGVLGLLISKVIVRKASRSRKNRKLFLE